MRTFERYFEKFPAFLAEVISTAPDFVVPVAKKGAKLIRQHGAVPSSILRYRTFFELFDEDVRGKRISVIDDATQHTSALLEHRQFFEKRGALVDTYSFVGHDELYSGHRLMYDTQAVVGHFLSDPVYQEYVLQQSEYFQRHGNHFDLEHIVFEGEASGDTVTALQSELNRLGYLLEEDDVLFDAKVRRFAVDDLRFFSCVPFLEHDAISRGPLCKLKFSYVAETRMLAVSPLVFPEWKYRGREWGRDAFRDVPFGIPIPIASRLRTKVKHERLRFYYNLCYVYQLSLLRAACHESPLLGAHIRDQSVSRSADLAATLGPSAATQFEDEAAKYLRDPITPSFAPHVASSWPTPRKARRLARFADVLDNLREGYRRAVKRRKGRIGVHYYLPYRRLFAETSDPLLLSEELDRYCDVGTIVPAVVDQDGVMLRGIRSGETDSDRAWSRTQVLIPLAISQLLEVVGTDAEGVNPTVLNKLLSCFQFDYPQRLHVALHCLHGEPYRFGTFVRVFDRVRAVSRPSLYDTKRISPFYRFDPRSRTFSLVNAPAFLRTLSSVFDDRDEVPYSEIVSYFRFLCAVFRSHGRVDVLNALSLCRDEAYFYAHLKHNLDASFQYLHSYLTVLRPDAEALLTERALKVQRRDIERSLVDAREHAQSALEKIDLARSFDQTMTKVVRPLGARPEYLRIVERMVSESVPMRQAFLDDLELCEKIARCTDALAATLLALESPSPKRERELLAMSAEAILTELSRDGSVPVWGSDARGPEVHDGLTALLGRVHLLLVGLPASTLSLERRIEEQGKRRARNKATAMAYRFSMVEASILFIDFSGLRDIPEPKEGLLRVYYEEVERHCTRALGTKLYGGAGGDDAYSWMFNAQSLGIEAARAIKNEFRTNLLFTNYDVKFGLCSVELPDVAKEESMLNCWGIAKDCCEYKSDLFRNVGDLLIGEASLRRLSVVQREALRVEAVDGVFVGAAKDQQVFRVPL